MFIVDTSHRSHLYTYNLDEPQEILGENQDISQYFLQRSFSQKRRKSVRKNLVMNLQPLSPTEINDSPSPYSSPPTSSFSNSGFSRPSSPIEHFFRRSPALRSHFYPNLNKAIDQQAEYGTTLDRLHRSRSKSCSVTAVAAAVTHDNNIPDVLHQLTRKDKKALQMERVAQLSDDTVPKLKREAGIIAPGDHFRPMPFEVKAELDNFFGQTKGQKRQLALRVKDENGHLWFDGIEQEEFAKLLSSAPNSPIISSRKSSNAYSPCHTPTFGRSRQASIVIGSFPLTLLKAFESQDVACYTYLPLSPRHLLSYGVGAESAQPRERRRKRSPTDLRRGNVVIVDEPLKKDFEEGVELSGEDEQDKQDITLPAFLPLKRHQANTALLNEAFSQGEGMAPLNDKSLENFNPTALTSRTNSRRGKRPANLHLHFKNFEDGSVSPLRAKERKSLCFTPGSASFYRNNPFDDGLSQRRGSSFELGRLSSPQRLQAGFPYLIDADTPLYDVPTRTRESKEKADAILGKTFINENLLVPGGLPTGEQVYDGLDIPCRSVHLQSDDEDGDDPVKPKKAFGAVKAWLRGRA